MPETAEMERGSILKEIGLYKSGMAQLCDRAWHELIFQGTLLERFVLGTEETVSALSRDNLMAFYNDCVSPNRLTLVTSGGISIDVLAESFNEHLIMKPSRVEMNMPKALLPKQRKQSISVVHNETSDQVFMTLGFRTGSIFEKDVSILDLIAGVTGGSRASLLLKKLRYEKGLVYSASAVSYGLSDAGEWSIHTSTSVSQVNEAIHAIFSILREIKEVGLPDDLVEASKESAVKSLRSRYQTSASWVG
ncbi:MAG TPA: insulinase family protein, partial [Candidatus Angelobacter sp.]|nr:insulinase family protein [Candidatus Angelobacter sp.]